MNERYYFLEDDQLVSVDSIEEYGERTKNISFDKLRRVAETTLDNGIWVSTVCLMLDHNWGEGPPLVFETMVFPSGEDKSELDMDRYSTLEKAQEGHKKMVIKWQELTNGK